MKFVVIITLVLFSLTSHSQSMSCSKLYGIVTTDYDSKSSQVCYMSSMLAKVDYYRLEDMGFVVAYIKSSDYDIYGKPYIFCGISTSRWNAFVNEAVYGGSWGESFHQYIRDYTCNCN